MGRSATSVDSSASAASNSSTQEAARPGARATKSPITNALGATRRSSRWSAIVRRSRSPFHTHAATPTSELRRTHRGVHGANTVTRTTTARRGPHGLAAVTVNTALRSASVNARSNSTSLAQCPTRRTPRGKPAGRSSGKVSAMSVAVTHSSRVGTNTALPRPWVSDCEAAGRRVRPSPP